MILRQRVIEAAQSVMLTYATGTDLDNIAATFSVQRLTITPADTVRVPADLLAKVQAALNDENVRPVADRVTVQSATMVSYTIDAVLYLFPGPEAEPIREAAEAKLIAYTTAQHRLGRDSRLSAIYAALHVEGVQRVELKSPAADIELDKTQASFCTAYTLKVGGYDE